MYDTYADLYFKYTLTKKNTYIFLSMKIKRKSIFYVCYLLLMLNFIPYFRRREIFYPFYDK